MTQKMHIYSIIRSITVPLFLATALLFMGASCSLKVGATKTPGLYKSTDHGITWGAKTVLVSEKGSKSRLANIEVRSLTIDPRNSNLVYMGTTQDGLFASDNAGESWTLLIPGQSIVDIAFDLSSRCVLYALTPKQVYKTSDCASSWEIILNETRGDVDLTSMLVHTLSPNILFVTTTGGDLFQSQDRGISWKSLYRFTGKPLRKITSDRYNADVLYIATLSSDVYRSRNRGSSWEEISSFIQKNYDRELYYRALYPLSREDSLLLSTHSAIFRTLNGGQTWEKLALLTTREETRIFAMTVNPENDAEIFYSTRNTIYRTNDGGKTWNADPLPSGRSGSVIRIDPNNTAHVYLGLRTPQKKSRYFYSPEEDVY